MRCTVCGLPTVPFGGEDICMSERHAAGYDDDVDPEYERELLRADQQLEDDEALALADTEPPGAT